MDNYKQILIEKINNLKKLESPIDKTNLIILLQLLGELERKENQYNGGVI